MEKTRYDVTIVVAVRNGVSTIRDTFRSLAIQETSLRIEVLIFDALSDDGTSSIVSEYTSNNTFWSHYRESDDGLYGAWNKGIRLAQSPYIFFLNADDTLVDEFVIQSLLDAVTENNAVSVGGQTVMINPLGKEVRDGFGGGIGSMAKKMTHLTPASIFETAALRNLSGFDRKYKVSSDYDLVLRLYLEHPDRMHIIIRDVVNFSVAGMSNLRLQKEAFKEVRVIVRDRLGYLGYCRRVVYEYSSYVKAKIYMLILGGHNEV